MRSLLLSICLYYLITFKNPLILTLEEFGEGEDETHVISLSFLTSRLPCMYMYLFTSVPYLLINPLTNCVYLIFATETPGTGRHLFLIMTHDAAPLFSLVLQHLLFCSTSGQRGLHEVAQNHFSPVLPPFSLESLFPQGKKSSTTFE